MIEQAPNILSKIGGDGDEAISPREYVRLIRELSKVNREASDSLNRLMAAGRLNTGQAQTISETRHTGTVGVAVAVAEDPIEREKRLDWLIDIHQRSRAHVPGAYRGEEAGIIDIVPEAVPANDGPTPETRVALVALNERGETVTPRGVGSEEAESNARRALAERSMPAEQVEKVIDRARGKAEREGRALADVLESVLTAQPGRVA